MPQALVSIVVAMRRVNHPHEACALLFGHVTRGGSGPVIEVKAVREIENLVRSPVAFEIDPVVQYQMMEEEKARDPPRSLVGILHTHPGNQFVSGTDVKYMKNAARLSTLLWLIAGDGKRGELDIGAYIVDGGKVREIPLVYT